MAHLRKETLLGMIRELLGTEVSDADLEEVLAQIGPWQEPLARLRELDLDGVEPAFLVDRGKE